MIRGKVLTILAALLGVTAACSLGVAAYIIIQPGTSPENSAADTEAQLAGVEIVDHTGEEEHIDNDALPDISVDNGAVWTDSSNPESEPEPESVTSVSEPEPEVLEPEPEPEPEPESVISESEPEPEPEYQNPGTHGGYLHEVGGARFYTEHDINQWLRPDEDYPEYFDFDIEQMLIDIWCENGGGIIENKVGFSYTNGEDWTRGVWFEVPDSDNDRLYHMATILYVEDGIEYTTAIRIYNCPGPYGEEYYSILNNYTHIIHRDLAPLILLAIEKMEANPYDGVLNDLNLNENFYCD